MRYRIRIVLSLLCFLSLTGGLSAEEVVWEAKVPRTGDLLGEWLGDRGHFVADAGRIALQAPEGIARSLIASKVQLPEGDVSWQGVVEMRTLPTSHNYTYILLAQLEREETKTRCLALAFGGGEPTVSLCEAHFTLRSWAWWHEAKQDKILIRTASLPPYLLRGMAFLVRKTADNNLLLYLSGQDLQMVDLVDAVEYPHALSRDNRLGIYVSHSSGQKSGVWVSDLKVSKPKAGQVGGEGDSQGSGEQGDSSGGQGADNTAGKDDNTDSAGRGERAKPTFLLSEVMANPREGSVEYIELYHTGQITSNLSEYSLGLGATREQIRKHSMARLTMPLTPGYYYVLTAGASALLTTYPEASSERVIEVRLPQLRNAGFVLQLYHRDELIDEMEYSPERLGKGLKSRRGVALERKRLEAGSNDWQAAHKSRGYATPTMANSYSGQGGKVAKDEDGRDTAVQLSDLLQRIATTAGWDIELRVFDVLGQKLLERGGQGALQWLQGLQEGLRGAVDGLGRGGETLIITVRLRHEDEGEELYDFKLRSYA